MTARRAASLTRRLDRLRQHFPPEQPDALSDFLAVMCVDPAGAGLGPNLDRYRPFEVEGHLTVLFDALAANFNEIAYRALLHRLRAAPDLDSAVDRLRLWLYEEHPGAAPRQVWSNFLLRLEQKAYDEQMPLASEGEREQLLRRQLCRLRASDVEYEPVWLWLMPTIRDVDRELNEKGRLPA